jgi:transposase-like protein
LLLEQAGQARFAENRLYGLEVSPDLISTVTDEVLAEVEQWQRHPCSAPMVHPVFATLIFDGELACLNLFGVVVGIAPRATMRFAPDDP